MSNTANLAAVANLEPAAVWRYFAELSAVPRPSKHEEQARAHVRRFAEEHHFSYREDPAGNIIVEVPASPGCEAAPITVLQGHLDMVCEKNAGTEHNFHQDPIRLVVEQDAHTGQQIVRAAGTTLGADNGIGVALAFAVATTPEVVHGPLELLCTVDEEQGMTSAKALAPDFVRGRRMINLDTEEDNAIYIGCAGGSDTTLSWEMKAAPAPRIARLYRVTVSGLRGGHSGCDIHLNRGNAIKLLARVLQVAGVPQLQLAELRGGSKRNVIPREAAALVTAPAKAGQKLESAAQQIRDEAVRTGESGCIIRVERVEQSPPPVISRKDSQHVLTTLTALPHGVLAMVPDMPGLVQTSNSTSTVECELKDGMWKLAIGCLSRSSLQSDLHGVARQLAAIGQLAGAAVEQGNEYPGWAPNAKSPLLATARRVYEQLFGEPPGVTAIHAGLECGLIGERMGDGQMDMISLGPRIEGAHSPDERLYVATVPKTWRLLTAILAELARG